MSEHWEIEGSESIPDTLQPHWTNASRIATIVVVAAIMALAFIL